MRNRSPHIRGRRWSVAALATVLAVGAAADVGVGASSNVVVSMDVTSATRVVPTQCATGASGRTDLGTVLPGTNGIGTAGCEVEFGSSNDVGRLRMRQPDGVGAAMYRPFTGSLDTSFATAGYQSTDVTGGDDVYIESVRIPDGGGYFLLGRTDNAVDDDVFVEKRDTNFALVGGWGVGGRRIIDYTNNDFASKLEIDASGRVVVFGKDGSFAAVVHRLTAGGALDGAFGVGGTATPGTNTQSGAFGTVLSDGRVLVALSDDDGPNRNVRMVVLTASGALDTSVGGGDGIGSYYDSGTGHDDIQDVVQAPGGDAYVLVNVAASGGQAQVWRFNGDTTLDTTWAAAGKTVSMLATCCGISAAIGNELAVASDGKLVVAGYVNGGGNDWWIARLTSAGALDASFAGTGVQGDDPSLYIHRVGLLLADDGSYVLTAGQDWDYYDTAQDGGWVIRVTTTGTIDDLAGAGYHALLHDAGSSNSSLIDPVQGPDGSLYAIGYANYANDLRTMAVKLDSRTIPQYDSGVADQDFDSTVNAAFGACLVSLSSGTPSAPWAAYGASGCDDDLADNAKWLPIAANTSGPTLQVASAPANVDTATATLRFGLHTVSSTQPGRWYAPIVLEVVAP